MNGLGALVSGLLLVACILGCQTGAEAGKKGGATNSTPTPEAEAPLTVYDPETETRRGGPLDPEAEQLRQLAFAYWEAFNAYDIDAVLNFLEPGYRSLREEQVRSDLGRLKQFGVKLGVSEQIPPVIGESGDWEMLLLMKEPLGVRILRMAYQKSGDRWYISHAEEVK